MYLALADSQHLDVHASRLLDQFAPSTLLKYFAAWTKFRQTLQCLGLSIATLSESQLADVLVTTSLAKRSDCSAGAQITIKAVRWMATNAGIQSLSIAWSPLISSLLNSRIPRELKESLPLSLYTIIQFEGRLLMSSCSLVETVVLGSILTCVWGGLRFTDAQRCGFNSFCYDGQSLRASCWRTKTSSRGQPFGVQAHGFLSLGGFNWMEKWLITLDELWDAVRSTNLGMDTPDFLFPSMDPEGISSPWVPMTYAEGLAWIRRMASLPWKSQHQDASQWTVHSMNSTLLAWGSQMVADGQVTQEERLLQGHHRQGTSTSLRLYSRDDVHGQLSVQRKLIDRVHRGQRFSTPRTGERSVRQLNLQFKWSFFRKDSPNHCWQCFNFNQIPVVPDSPLQEPTGVVDSSSSESSSGDSDSSDGSWDHVDYQQSSLKKQKTDPPLDPPDELFVAFISTVQHAMIATDKDRCPFYQGSHFQAACGARLDPDRTKFSQEPDHGLSLCQRPACVKAWKATLL